MEWLPRNHCINNDADHDFFSSLTEKQVVHTCLGGTFSNITILCVQRRWAVISVTRLNTFWTSDSAYLWHSKNSTKKMASSFIISWNIDGEKSGNSGRFYFLRLQNHCRWWLQPWNSKRLAPWKKSSDKPRQHIKMQRHHFAKKGPYSQSYGFSSSHVWMWELDHKEGWVPKNQCFQTVLLKKTLERPLDFKEIKPVNPKGNQSWMFIGRTEAEATILWPPDMKNWLTGKDPDAEKDWRQAEKAAAEDELVR